MPSWDWASSGSEGDHEEDPDPPPPSPEGALPAAVVLRRVGRPRGVLGSREARAQRDAILQGAGLAQNAGPLVHRPRVHPEPPAAATPLQTFVRPGAVASNIHHQVVLAVAARRDRDIDDPVFDRLVEHCLGDIPRPALPVKAEAKLLGFDTEKTSKLRLVDLAATIHFAVCGWVASFLSHLAMLLSTGAYRGICCACQAFFDETPLPFRNVVFADDRISVEHALAPLSPAAELATGTPCTSHRNETSGNSQDHADRG